MSTFEVPVQGPYSLQDSAQFVCGFTPATGSGSTSAGELRLGFLAESDGYRPTAVALAQAGAAVTVRCEAGPSRAVAGQVARMLSLDHDAHGLARVGAEDRVVRQALAERPGFRPVCFASAYEAALWGVLSQRTPMRVAATLKRRLALQSGAVVQAWGEELITAPPPERLLEIEEVPGLPREKLGRLRALGEATLSGALCTERLRRLPREEALAELRALPGVGPWTSELIFMRGCGVADELTSSEPRVFAAVQAAYGLPEPPTMRELARLAERWRPYRMWVSVLLVSRFMRDPMQPVGRRGACPA